MNLTTTDPRQPPTPQTIFGDALQHIAGSALAQLGYKLHSTPMQQSRGLFRLIKPLPPVEEATPVCAFVEYQLLYYAGAPSRFRVNLLRNRGDDPRGRTDYAAIETTLSVLLWDTFGVQQLAAAEHWWMFNNLQQLHGGLVESAKLCIGFGIPWLEGTLRPEDLE